MGKTENDYIAEYVKERCPEVIQTIDYSLWRVSKAASEAVQTIVDNIKAIDWSKVPIDEKEKQGNDSSDMDNSDMRSDQSNTEHCSDSGTGKE
jgi:hypothetical protein